MKIRSLSCFCWFEVFPVESNRPSLASCCDSRKQWLKLVLELPRPSDCNEAQLGGANQNEFSSLFALTDDGNRQHDNTILFHCRYRWSQKLKYLKNSLQFRTLILLLHANNSLSPCLSSAQSFQSCRYTLKTPVDDDDELRVSFKRQANARW